MEAVNAGLTAGVHFSAAQEWGLWGRATVFCPRSYEGKLLGAAFRLASKVSPPSLQGLSLSSLWSEGSNGGLWGPRKQWDPQREGTLVPE